MVRGTWSVRFTSHVSRLTSAFTLVELIVVLAIVTAVMGLSVPWFARLSAGHRLKAATREVAGMLQTARSYAISLGQPHAVVFASSGKEPDGDAARYHIEDAAGRTVEKPAALPGGVTFTAPVGEGEAVTFEDRRVTFAGTGSASESGVVWLSGGKGRYSRVTVSEVTGQVRVDMGL